MTTELAEKDAADPLRQPISQTLHDGQVDDFIYGLPGKEAL
jgi:hypothetical protein